MTPLKLDDTMKYLFDAHWLTHFHFQLFEFGVKEDYPVGVEFGAVTGADNDIGTNAILFYHIIGDGKATSRYAYTVLVI